MFPDHVLVKTAQLSLTRRTEAETGQVATSKLPYGTREKPFSAAIFLS